MGKTQFGIKSLIDKHVSQQHSILLPTENISLSLFLQETFPEFSHYQQDVDAFNSNLLICQLESLHKVKKKVWCCYYGWMYFFIITSWFSYHDSSFRDLNFCACSASQTVWLYMLLVLISPAVFSSLTEGREQDPPYMISYTHRPLADWCECITLTKNELLCSLSHAFKNGENCDLVLQTLKESE